jgi:putative ABC transport system substrate-binding protein
VPSGVEAQPPAKLYRIGFLSNTAGPGVLTAALLEGLGQLGYVEGQNFVMEYRWAAGKSERLPDLASDLIRAKVEVIVTSGAAATLAAQQATQTIPIVFGSMGAPGAPVERGVVASLQRPGGNITGLAVDLGASKILQLLKEMVQKVSHVGLFYDPTVWSARALELVRERTNAAAKPLGLSVQWVPVQNTNDVDRAFTQLDSKTNGLLLENSGSLLRAQKRICALALQRRLPAVGHGGWFADAGCLMGYGQDVPDMYRRAATFVDRILKGAKPADLPVAQPDKFDLVVNTATAKALGLTLAPGMLAHATRITESPAGATQAGRVYKIGMLSLADRPDTKSAPMFVSALRDRGYEPGRTLVFIERFAAGNLEQLPGLAADLIRQKVDILLTAGSSETLAALKATATIPIVFVSPSPVELGIVRSLARPSGNATGMSADVTPEVTGKLMELLKQVVPRLARVTVLWNPDQLGGSRIYESAVRKAGQVLRVVPQFVNVRTGRDLEAAFVAIASERPDALMIGVDPIIAFNQKRITDFALKNNLATVSYERSLVDDGGLMSYGPHLGDMMRGLAAYIDKILKGAKPADLPVEQPTKFELVINMKTAKALGVKVPQSILVQANEVIE